MFIKHTLRNLMAVLLVAISLTFTACSDSTVSERKYSGPGSVWDTTFRSDGTFTLIKYPDSTSTTPDMTVNGTYIDLSTGFNKLTVTSASGTDAPSAGDLAYGLEIPGYVFVLKPMGSSDQIIPMVTGGVCPSSDIDGNWVNLNVSSGYDITTNHISGTFHVNYATSEISLPARYKLDGNDVGGQTVGTGTCSNGIMTIGNVELFLTDTGGAIVNTDTSSPTNAEYVFAFAQKAITSTSSLDDTYSGLVFNDSGTAGSKITPVKIVCSSGTCTGNEFTDVEAGTTTTSGVVLTLGTSDDPSTGMIKATIQSVSGGTPFGSITNVMCMFDKDASGSGKTIGSCVGQDPGGNTTQMFNVLFTSI